MTKQAVSEHAAPSSKRLLSQKNKDHKRDVLIFSSLNLQVDYHESVKWMYLAQAVVKTVMNILFYKRQEISWPLELFSDSEGFFS